MRIVKRVYERLLPALEGFDDRLRIRFYYPFTLAGTILFASSIYLLGTAFATRNPYSFLLSAVAFLIPAFFVLMGRLQVMRFRGRRPVWDSTMPLFARVEDLCHKLLVEDIRSFPFFRLHFCLSGRLQVGRDAYLTVLQETSTRGGGNIDIPIFFPVCGVFHARAMLKVKDIFGLTRTRFGTTWLRQINVRPALLPDREFFPIEALDGLENKSKLKESDVERYFMREYIPGDRVRDINWKASSRLSELLTRISPVTQEKTQILTIIFRAFSRIKRETTDSIMHLNYVKSWLLLFLKVLKKAHPEFQFRIICGEEVRLLENELDIDQYSEELSGIFFRSPQPGPANPASGAGDLFMFSTPYDVTLSSDMGLLPGERIHLFRTRAAGKDERSARTMRIFPSWQHLLYPSLWFVFRDRKLTNPPLGGHVSGHLEEETLEVRLV